MSSRMSTERGCHRLQEGYTCEVSRVAAGERRAENAGRMQRGAYGACTKYKGVRDHREGRRALITHRGMQAQGSAGCAPPRQDVVKSTMRRGLRMAPSRTAAE